MMVGITPLLSLHNLVLFLMVCLLRVNLSMFFVSVALFTLVGFILDPAFDWIGYKLLVEVGDLRSFWILITSGAIWPFFRFYNTVVLGSLALSLILFWPVFIL